MRSFLLAVLCSVGLPALAQNTIQLENAKTAGVTTQWQISDANYASLRQIEGYASATSVNRGGSINLYVQTKSTEPTYTINIYRIGWYGGAGGRLVAGPITRSRTPQPACTTHSATRMVECNWTDPYVLNIPNNTSDPTDWASGVYLAKLTASASGKQSYIIFVVRDDARRSDVLFQTSVTTYAAYNNWGGYDFYDTDSLNLQPATKVSFDRPYKNPQHHMDGKGAGDFLSWEINMLRFVEREGYDVTYSTNIDTHTNPSALLNHSMFMSVGHDEYYTKQMYDAAEAARDSGVNLGFFGANNIYWQVRLEPNTQTGQANRTVVGYKYEYDPMQATNPSLATYLWRETVRAPINRPEAALIGVMYDYNSLDSHVVISDCSSWVCDGANLSPGSVLSGMLGYEVDRIDASSPPGISTIASSPYDACINPSCTAVERRYSHVTYYTAASGAGVFATGSMQWNWGLDAFSPGTGGGLVDQHGDRSNAAVQQITRNVLNRLSGSGGANRAPQITSTPVTSGAVGVPYSYDVNATDPDGDALTYSLTQAPTGMTINASTGLIGWTPSSTQGGNQAVTARVTDARGLFASQSFTVSVGTTNRAPQITSAPITSATVGAAYSYDVDATDADGDALTYSLTQAPSGMTINAASGLIAWTPSSAQTGNQAVTARVTDARGLFASQSFTVVVASGTVPSTTRVDMATPATYTAAPGGTVAITLNWYRIPMAANYLQFMHLQSASGAIFSVDDHSTTSGTWASGPFTQTRTITIPATLAAGTYDIRVGLSGGSPWIDHPLAMGTGVTNPSNDNRYKVGTITIGSNNAPQITSTPLTTANQGVAYSYDVNATDADGDALTFSLPQAPSGMTINSSTGLIAWTPTAAQVGTQAVTARVTDARGASANQSYTVVVAGSNVAPVANSDSYQVAQNGTLTVAAPGVLGNDTDANGDVLTAQLVSNPASGTLAFNTNGSFTYTPPANFTGAVSFTYQAKDPSNAVSAVATVSIAVVANAAPQITSTPVTTATTGVTYSYDVNATDPEGDALTYSLTQSPSGMAINAATGLITWTPSATQTGSQPVTVRVTDARGAFANQSFNIVVSGANVAPVANNDAYQAVQGGVLSVAAPGVLGNDTDANGDVLTAQLVSNPASGTLALNANGSFTYTPLASFTGTVSFTYRARDPSGAVSALATASITVVANSAPQITTTPVTSATVGVAYAYDVNATDPEGDLLTYSLTQAPSGMTINAASGLIAWTPSSAQSGNQAVTVRVTDARGQFASQSFTIVVAGGTVPSTTRVDMSTPATYTGTRGGTVAITLNWYRIPMAANYLQFMHLQSASGAISSVDDHGTTSATWASGPFTETRTITIPASLAVGTYDIRVGLSGGNPWTDKPLLMGTGVTNPSNDNRYKVGTLTVQ